MSGKLSFFQHAKNAYTTIFYHIIRRNISNIIGTKKNALKRPLRMM